MTPLTPLQPWIAGKIGCVPDAFNRHTLATYQLRQLRQTVARCRARSPFYRQQLAPFPETPTSLQAWQTYPFTTAEDLRQNPLSFLCVSQSDIERVVTLDTTGTSGPPKRLCFSAADQELTRDFFQVGMSTFTAPGDRVLILLPCERPGSVGDLLAQSLDRLGAHSIRHGLAYDVAETQRVLHKSRANVVVGVPIQVLALVRTAGSVQQPQPRLKSVLLTTDHVPDAIVQAVEAAWGCTVYNHYGMTEMGLGGAVECQARSGYHLREADLYVEIVDPLTGAPLPDGETGEIVFTTLTRTAMPLLRYRTGDISRFLPEPCPCGSQLHRLEKVRYRWPNRLPMGHDQFLTMADLDEALFALDDVLDFVATPLQGILQLTVQTMDQGIESSVREVLSTLPALQSTGMPVQVYTQAHALTHGGKRTFRPAGKAVPLP